MYYMTMSQLSWKKFCPVFTSVQWITAELCSSLIMYGMTTTDLHGTSMGEPEYRLRVTPSFPRTGRQTAGPADVRGYTYDPGGFHSWVARCGCFGIGWKAGPAGLPTGNGCQGHSADCTAVNRCHCSVIDHVAVFGSCKFSEIFAVYGIRIVLCCKRTADELCDSRCWTVSFERRNCARNSLSSYFVSASSHSFTSCRLLGFVTLKNSRISMSVFVRSAIVHVYLCKKAKFSSWLLEIAGSGLNLSSKLIEFN